MADNVVANDPVAALDLYGKGIWGPYYVNRQTAVALWINSIDDLVRAHTVDGGLTWDVSVVQAGDIRSFACYLDKEVPADTGVLVHCISLDEGGDDATYFSINAETGAAGANNDTVIQGTIGVVTLANLNRCCITKTRSGDLIAAYSTQSAIGCERSVNSGSTWSVIDDVYETDTEEDFCLLFAANTGADEDAAALFLDRSANALTVKIYDQSIDTWVNETTVFGTMTADDIYFNFDGSVRHSDGKLLVNGHSAHNTSGDDFLAAAVTLTLTPSVAAKTNVFTNQAASALCAVIIDQQTDEWFVGFAKGGTWEATVDIVFHKSDDGGATWGSEQAYSETTDDYRALSGGRTIGENGGFVQWLFFDDDDVDILNNLVNDVLIQPGDAPIGGVWRFNHGNSSPILIEDGANGFLGVSGLAQAASADEADIQLKVYHQYLFKFLNAEFSVLTTASAYDLALRDDGVSSTNLLITPTTTGFLEDITGSDLVAANSLVNYIIDGSAAMHGDDVRVRQAQVSYENASILAPIFAGGAATQFGLTNFTLPGASMSTTEAERQHKIKRATIYKNLRVVNTNSTTNFDVSPTVDGVASTNVSVNVTGSGAFQDITGSQLFAAGELFGVEYLLTSGALTPTVLQIEANTFEDWKVATGEAWPSTRQYQGFTYRPNDTIAGEFDPLKSRIGTVLAGNLQTYITGAGGGDRDLTLRIGGSNSTNVTIDVTGTGFFEDITGVETVLDNDGAIFTGRASSGTFTTAWVAVEIPHKVVAADVTFPVIPIILMQAIQRASVH